MAAGPTVERRQAGGFGTGCEGGTGASPRVALLAPGMADELADRAQRGNVLLPALQPVLLALDGVPREEDEDEAHKLKTGGQTKVNKAEGGDVILPARAVDATILLPQHTGGIDDGAEVDGCGNVCCRGQSQRSRFRDQLYPALQYVVQTS